MILKTFEINKLKSDIKFFLIYGKNEGLKAESKRLNMIEWHKLLLK